jgi:hypothetical protein
MITLRSGILVGLAALIATLFGLGLGLGAMALLLLPIMVIALIPLLPVLLVVLLLRRLGLVRGRLGSLAAVIIVLLLFGSGIERLWHSQQPVWQHWLDDSRNRLQACGEQGGGSVTVLRDDDGLHLVCRPHLSRPGQPPDDADI